MKKANTPQISTRQSVSITKQELHIRPLPAPEELQHYETVQPGYLLRVKTLNQKSKFILFIKILKYINNGIFRKSNGTFPQSTQCGYVG